MTCTNPATIGGGAPARSVDNVSSLHSSSSAQASAAPKKDESEEGSGWETVKHRTRGGSRLVQPTTNSKTMLSKTNSIGDPVGNRIR